MSILTDLFDNLDVGLMFNKFLRKNWILVTDSSLTEKDIESPKNNLPSIYLEIYMVDDRKIIDIGLSYNSSPAIAVFKELISRYNFSRRKQILQLLSTTTDNWLFGFYKRTKFGHLPADREQIDQKIKCNQINDDKLTEILATLSKIQDDCLPPNSTVTINVQENGETKPWTRKVLWQVPSLDLMYTSVSEDQLLPTLEEVKRVLTICLQILSPEQIRERDAIEEQKRLVKQTLQIKIDLWQKKLKTEINPIKKRQYLDKIKSLQTELDQLNAA